MADIANIRTAQIAAATAVVGYDLLTAQPDARVPYPRIMDGVALVGSAAAGDTVIELRINGRRVGTYSNTATGVGVDKERDLMPLDLYVGANQLIEAVVTDAASTNAVVLQLEFHKAARKSFGGSRRTNRRSGNRRTNYRFNTSGMY